MVVLFALMPNRCHRHSVCVFKQRPRVLRCPYAAAAFIRTVTRGDFKNILCDSLTFPEEATGIAVGRMQRRRTRGKVYGSTCSVVLNKKRLLNSVMSPAFFPATGCNRADKGLCHFHASDATSPKMRAN